MDEGRRLLLTQRVADPARLAFRGRLPRREAVFAALLGLLVYLAGAVLSVVVAHLIVRGQWHAAFLLIVLLPGLVFFSKYPFSAVIVWLLLMPFLVHTTTSTERQLYWMIHRALPPLAIAVTLLTSLVGSQKRNWPRLGLPELAMATYVVLSLASIFTENPDPLATVYLFYDRVFIPFCLYLIVRLSGVGRREINLLVVAAFLISVSQVTIGMLSWSAPQVLPAAWLDKEGLRTVGSLSHANVFSTTLAWSGLLSLHLALNSKPGLIQMALKLTFLLSLYGIFVSFGRAGWLVGGLVVLGLAYLYPRFTVRIVLVAGVSLALFGAGLLAGQLSWAEQRLFSQEAERSALSRLPVAIAAVRMFEEKPLFGWGYGTFDEHDRQFYGEALMLPHDNKDHASHNLFLTVVAEQGIVGLLLFLCPVVWWLAVSWRKLPKLPTDGILSRKLLIILWLVVFGYIVVNNFSNMRVVFGLGLWWIVLALIACTVDVPRSMASFGRDRPLYRS